VRTDSVSATREAVPVERAMTQMRSVLMLTAGHDCFVRVSAVVLVLVTDVRTGMREVTVVVGAVVGAGVAAATAGGCSGAFVACRFSLAKIVMPPKLLSVIAAASVRSTSVEAMSGLRRRRRSVMWIREHPGAARA
jgi:hypothetical protein